MADAQVSRLNLQDYPPGTFQAIATVNFPIGTPVVATAEGVAPADYISAPHCVGLAAQAGVAGKYVPIQTSGFLELTLAQWEVVNPTDSFPTLTPGRPYYLAPNGAIISTTSATSGTFANQIGLALSSTLMQITIGAAVGPHP